VRRLEQAVIDLLATFGIVAERRAGAPGVYVADAKIAALGLRLRNGMSYHGLALNIDLDLAPFLRINPCGYAGLRVTRLKDLGVELDGAAVRERFIPHLARCLYGGTLPEVLRDEACWPRAGESAQMDRH